MKQILVPTDFSDCAQAASDFAIQLAVVSGSELVFLHLAIDHYPKSASGIPREIVAHEVQQERYKLQKLVSQAEAAKVSAKYELILGNGQEHIEDYIKPFEIDWMVMGSHGATGIREAIIGSKTQHVLRYVDIPCLVIKQKVDAIPRNILLASTFTHNSHSEIKEAVNYASLVGGMMHLLHINSPDQKMDEKGTMEIMSKMMDQFKSIASTVNIAETNDKEFGITQFAKDIKADIIVVPNERKSVMARIFNPVLAEQLINHAQLPVLVLSAN